MIRVRVELATLNARMGRTRSRLGLSRIVATRIVASRAGYAMGVALHPCRDGDSTDIERHRPQTLRTLNSEFQYLKLLVVEQIYHRKLISWC